MKTSLREDLFNEVLPRLKISYVNARTDVMAEMTGLVEKGSPHALPTLENHANDTVDGILTIFQKHFDADIKEAKSQSPWASLQQ